MKHIVSAAIFFAKNPGPQCYNHRCRATVRAIKSLEKLGKLKVYPTNQAEFIG